MKKKISFTAALCFAVLAMWSFASVGWKMDYGKPKAQFHAKQVAAKGKPFIGKKITIKGVVEKIDTTDPKAAVVTLVGGIRCEFGKFKAMAEGKAVGKEVYVDGILRACVKGEARLSPALYRDPKARFEPVK